MVWTLSVKYDQHAIPLSIQISPIPMLSKLHVFKDPKGSSTDDFILLKQERSPWSMLEIVLVELSRQQRKEGRSKRMVFLSMLMNIVTLLDEY